MALDPNRGAFFVGSVHRQRIVRRDPDGGVSAEPATLTETECIGASPEVA
jgi:hypothetical protein